MKKDADYVSPTGEWISPLFDVPWQYEQVAIDCDIKVANGVKRRVIQTAIYEQTKDGKEIWHVPTPFIMIRWWLRYPKMREDKIIPMAGQLREDA